ncbi:hypothetical protein GDO78_017245 [Eleutherodactylus coqui]|uniref:Uncharacterized protein n=1 Tax=Eleutherodactylus coqui TaxID=57060 RepID=A0A8J6B8P8_ELECQ|nr:hypothetical protein GDO78_017245 [Eleutherodactylus coqui]
MQQDETTECNRRPGRKPRPRAMGIVQSSPLHPLRPCSHGELTRGRKPTSPDRCRMQNTTRCGEVKSAESQQSNARKQNTR